MFLHSKVFILKVHTIIMIYFFEGPDQCRKTTMARVVSQIVSIPLWDRSPYLPHHSFKESHDDDAIFYILDELRTISLFKKLGGDVIVDRHPLISEIVYSDKYKRENILKVPDSYDFSDEFIFLMPPQCEGSRDFERYYRVIQELEAPAYVVASKKFYNALIEVLDHIPHK